MAIETVSIDTGAGANIAADLVGGASYQVLKMAWGADGTATLVDTGTGLPIQGTVTETNSSAIATDIGNIDINMNALRQTAATEGSALQSGILLQGDNGTNRTNVQVDTNGYLQVDIVTMPTVTETNSAAILADTANIDTNVATLAGTVTAGEVAVSTAAPVTGSLELCKAEDAASASGDVGIASLIVRDDALSADAGTSADGDFTYFRANNSGALWIAQSEALPAGTNVIGDIGISGTRTSGGTTGYRNIDVDETEDEIKATAGQVYWVHCVSLNAAPIYLHLYNATAASVTVGTTTPQHTFVIPSQGNSNGAGFNFSVPNGIEFDTAITVAATTTVGGTAGPGTNEVILNLGYA